MPAAPARCHNPCTGLSPSCHGGGLATGGRLWRREDTVLSCPLPQVCPQARMVNGSLDTSITAGAKHTFLGSHLSPTQPCALEAPCRGLAWLHPRSGHCSPGEGQWRVDVRSNQQFWPAGLLGHREATHCQRQSPALPDLCNGKGAGGELEACTQRKGLPRSFRPLTSLQAFWL